ncbi:hypothetical protein AY599_10400 [Leptolyngbya valderiana BDU 20041]|nr:hypothetical protein AY599_10400 [Leptolyngbya valderiana BDU 20041]
MFSVPFDRGELVAVLSINLFLSLGGFVLAGSLWQVRSRLSQLADTLSEVERHAAENLPRVPDLLHDRQQQIVQARDRYHRLLHTLSLFQQLLQLSLWLLRLTRQNNRFNPFTESPNR